MQVLSLLQMLKAKCVEELEENIALAQYDLLYTTCFDECGFVPNPVAPQHTP